MSIKMGGHESFVLREGWLTKGLKIVSSSKTNPFLDEDAIINFGVGTNMIKAIRYYLNASNFIVEEKSVCKINCDNGIDIIMKYDPYFEDGFSYYIFHYLFVINRKKATIFNMFFNNIENEYFSKDELANQFKTILRANDENFNENVLNKEIDTLIKLYFNDEEIKDVENTYISPLVDLKLLKKVDKKIYKKTNESLHKLTPALVYYSMIYCMNDEEDGISISDLINKENSPSKIFNLNKNLLNEYIDILRKNNYLKYETTAGLNMIYPQKSITLKEVIEGYYKNKC